jgi:2-methylisocitrate lyase-like PEP mutase family enzyme/predicted TIM-barrel fold metal-dependent hydrolase
MAKNGYKIFDADTHVGPNMDVLEPYLSAAEKRALERLSAHRRGNRYMMGERKYDRRLGDSEPQPADPDAYMGGRFTGAERDREPNRRADYDPMARIADLDFEGVDVNLMLPSGWFGCWTAIDDTSIELSMYRAYNRWMSDYCSAYTERLTGVVLVSGRDVEASLPELKRAASEPWAMSVFVYAPYGMPLDHPDLEPYWAAAAEYDLNVVLHTFTVMPPYAPGGLDSWDNLWLQRSSAHPWCGMRNMAAIIGCGVLDRYPNLRIGVLEAGQLLAAVLDSTAGRAPEVRRGSVAGSETNAERLCDVRPVFPDDRDVRGACGHAVSSRPTRRWTSYVCLGLPARRELVSPLGRDGDGLGSAGNGQEEALLGQCGEFLPPLRGPDAADHDGRVKSVSAATRRLRELVERRGKVLAVLGAPNAYHAKIMEGAGVEAAFIGTSIAGGNYTGLPDTGVLSSTECVEFGGYIARAVSFPVILDGDTGHGGVTAVRRLVHECIRAGIAGIRLDDQAIEAKRSTQMSGIEIVPRDHAVARYRAAIDAKNEVDPDFVVMAQCYARDAMGGGLEELIARLNRYRDVGGVDWVQFESPHSVDEVKQVRASVSGFLSAMKGKLPQALSLDEHASIGLNAAWYTFLPDQVLKAASWEFMQDFRARGLQAWIDFQAAHPQAAGARRDLTGMSNLYELEQRYLSSSGN